MWLVKAPAFTLRRTNSLRTRLGKLIQITQTQRRKKDDRCGGGRGNSYENLPMGMSDDIINAEQDGLTI